MHVCRCSGCAGARHRWVGCVQMASEPDGQRRRQFETRVHSAWNKADRTQKQRTSGRPTKKEAKAATDSVVVDIVEWLAENPTSRDQIDTFASALGGEVVDLLDETLSGESRRRVGHALADHFWCGLLAAVAEMLTDVQATIDKVPDLTADAIIRAMREQGERSWIKEAQVKLYVETAWRAAKEVLPSISQPLRAVQLIGVVICPAPEEHSAVLKHCVHPLAGEVVSSTTKLRLEQALTDW